MARPSLAESEDTGRQPPQNDLVAEHSVEIQVHLSIKSLVFQCLRMSNA